MITQSLPVDIEAEGSPKDITAPSITIISQSSEEQKKTKGPRILYVTPEITYVSSKMCNGAENIHAKSGGLADVSATLVDHLQQDHVDVHLAIPHYKNLFKKADGTEHSIHWCMEADSRIHLAEDSAFYRKPSAYHGDPHHLRGASLAFQRELINHIIPRVKPDIVHCNDWMTGLIPAACKKLGIKTVFTIHNIHRERTTLAEIESRGIDVRDFWELLFYEDYPYSFDSSYHHNPIDLLSSGIQNADYVTTVSPTFLQEMMHRTHGELPPSICANLHTKAHAGYAKGILNAPNPSYRPSSDEALDQPYTAETHQESKRFNKHQLQKRLGLIENPDAPLFFWPSRLDPLQKGCQLLSTILHELVVDYTPENLQIVVVGDGDFSCHFHHIVERYKLQSRVALCPFSENLSRQAFGASDFVLMPSSFEPCGLPQMIGTRYGTIPIVHNTGGLHDTVDHFSEDYTTGNGFVFDYFDSNGLRWAIDQAMIFYKQPLELRKNTIIRVIHDASQRFRNDIMFEQYAEVYQTLTE